MATLNTTLSGTDVSAFQISKDFVSTEKLEQTIVLNNTTQAIDFSFIDAPTVFTFSGDAQFVVSITANASTIDFVVDGANTGIFTYITTAAFAATITDITVKELNSVPATIKVGIYNG